MPELPEVETIARGLRAPLEGACVERVEIPGPHALGQDAALFRSRLLGACCSGVRRRGKLLLLDMQAPVVAGALTLAVHLRMTGRMFMPAALDAAASLADSPHTHVRIFFQERPFPLLFHDVRKFGRLMAFTPAELAAWDFYASLGPEPLDVPEAAFLALFRSRKGRIKALLLDQRVIAGIGNIYADETLFRARIRPDTPAHTLRSAELSRLYEELRTVLSEAIAACGSTLRDYRNAQGDAGAFQNRFQVYGKAGTPCPCCGTPLSKSTVAGRTSVYCSQCQK